MKIDKREQLEKEVNDLLNDDLSEEQLYAIKMILTEHHSKWKNQNGGKIMDEIGETLKLWEAIYELQNSVDELRKKIKKMDENYGH